MRNSAIGRRLAPPVIVVLACAVFASSASADAFDAMTNAAAELAPNAIQAENAKPGTPGWDEFASVASQTAVSGYASEISVDHGDSIDFFVTTTAASVKIDVYRTGWYGGVGARLVAAMGSFPGQAQAIPAPDPVTGMVECHWARTATLNIPADWVSGVYLARLTASNGNSSFIFFVVRNDGGSEAINFQTSVTTYHAYNAYGGTSLYDNLTNKSIFRGAHATKVSFDRPFDPLDGNGSGQFFWYEYPFIRWAECKGYDLTYTTNVDTHTNANPLTNHRAFLSLGHDEYWSKQMRDNVQGAIDNGVNVAFFSANSVFWQVRFEPDSSGTPNRTLVGYKEFAIDDVAPGPDPMYGVDNSQVTTHFRDAPVNRPENEMLGVMYQDMVGRSWPYVVQNASHWIYAGSGFTNGTSLPNIVGYEYDKVFNNGHTPPGVTVLSNSPVIGVSEGSGNSFSNSSIYTAPSGAIVFAGGTIQWAWGLDNYAGGNAVNAGFQRTTANILDRFIEGSGTPVPAVSLSPPAIAYGTQLVNTASDTQTSVLTNAGTAPLTITSIAMGGADAGDFAQVNDCPATLAPGEGCTLSVTFTPSAVGSRTAAVEIVDNATGSPHSLPLTGTGQAPGPAVTLTPTSLAFGTVGIGLTSAAKPVTLANTGNGPLTISGIAIAGTHPGDFNQSNDCPGTLAAGGSCTIDVRFAPTATGTRSASLRITDDAPGSPHSVALGGSGTTPLAKVKLSATTLAFGNQVLGVASAVKTLTVTNTGTGPLQIASAATAGDADFAITDDTCSGASVPVSGTCTVRATFTPAVAGARTGRIVLTDNAANSPQSVSLTGTGQTADLRTTLTSNRTTVARNARVNFVATALNGGPGKALGVSLREAIPAGTTFYSATFGTGVACTLPPVGGTGDVVCRPNNALGSINNGGSMRVTITVTATGASGSTITDSATVSTPPGATYDTNAANDTASVSVRIT
jgi:uncharacterized repeat protein (TIGR01451 family)